MYSTCLFCHAPLGANTSIEPLPVGRRVAFDAAKGRLWVVCMSCRRWNLTPLEERWEAVEECERRFRGTRLRTSTDNIGLAQIDDGLELIRIGQPQRPEFAAWRYGARLLERRRRAIITGVAATAITVPVFLAAQWGMYHYVAMGGGLSWWLAKSVRAISDRVRGKHRPILVPRPMDVPLIVTREKLKDVHLLVSPDDPSHWNLSVSHSAGWDHLRGRPAVRAAGTLLRWINFRGGSRSDVDLAVRYLMAFREPADVLADTGKTLKVEGGRLAGLALPRRLALEMLANEEPERLAFEGDLQQLEEDWREAEEVAAIADDMFVPSGVRQFIQRIRGEP